MKKIKLYIFTILISMIGIINVHAAKPNLTIDGTTTINLRSENIYSIKINTNTNAVKKVSFKVDVENADKLSINIDKDSSLIGPVALNNVELSTTVASGIPDGSTIAVLKIKNNGPLTTTMSSRITISNVEFTYNDTPESGEDAQKEVILSNKEATTTKAISSNAKLSGIGLNNNATLNPAWSASVNNYKINIPDTIRSLSITPDCETCNVELSCSDNCTISASGNAYKAELAIGKNIVTITSKSTDNKNTEKYTLTIYRGETTDGSVFLSSLNIEGYEFNEPFDKNLIDYTVTVPYEVDLVNILAIAEDKAAKIDIKNNSELQVGENIVTVTITSSESEEQKVYNITVTRLEEGEEVQEGQQEETPIPTKKNNTLLIIIITAIGLTIIGTSAYIIFWHKPNQKKKKPKKTEDTTPNKELEQTKTSIDVFDNEEQSHTVETALIDLMNTKEIIKNEEE